MLFNSFEFLVFLPIALTIYFLTHGKARLIATLILSYIFYAWWDWRFVGLLVFLTLGNYWLGIQIEEAKKKGEKNHYFLQGLVLNLGVLGLFKYYGFFLESLDGLLGVLGVKSGLPVIQTILPVGISFYTFEAISYLYGLNFGRNVAERSLLKLGLFMAFFPRLVAGPILRPEKFLPQLESDRKIDEEQILTGIELIFAGFFKKLVIADSLALVSDSTFRAPEACTAAGLLIGVVFYSFQIYCDFSGYSDIAIGLGRIMGFDLGQNFNRPFLSKSFSEFWTRWHISLSSWLKDYLYMPMALAGSRRGPAAMHLGLVLTMLLGGLWHGANWTFVVWGGMHGVLLVLQRFVSPWYKKFIRFAHIPTKVSSAFLVVFIFTLTTITFIFFRSPTIGQAWAILRAFATRGDWSFANVPGKFQVAKGAVLIGGLMFYEIFIPELPKKHEIRVAWRLAAGVAALLMIGLFGTFSSNAFIYFQF